MSKTVVSFTSVVCATCSVSSLLSVFSHCSSKGNGALLLSFHPGENYLAVRFDCLIPECNTVRCYLCLLIVTLPIHLSFFLRAALPASRLNSLNFKALFKHFQIDYRRSARKASALRRWLVEHSLCALTGTPEGHTKISKGYNSPVFVFDLFLQLTPKLLNVQYVVTPSFIQDGDFSM